MGEKSQHHKIRDYLRFKIGDLVVFHQGAYDIGPEDRGTLWIIKDYVNKLPEEFSVYDYVLTDGIEDVVAIDHELLKMEDMNEQERANLANLKKSLAP